MQAGRSSAEHLASEVSVRIVVVSPHRDDAAFSLGLSVEHWLHGQHRVDVLNCFTRSTYAPFSDAENMHSNDRLSFVSAVRKREDLAWNKCLGRALGMTDLDLLDAPLRLACNLDEVLSIEMRPGDRALARVEGALRKIAAKSQVGMQSGQVALLVPLAIGQHVDHRITRAAALAALSVLNLPMAFYEDLPYAARLEDVEKIAELAAGTGLHLEPCFTQAPAEDLTGAMRRKFRMAECYDSQIDNVTAHQIAHFAEHYAGRERVWGNEAWCRSSLYEPIAGSRA